jgi:hypothetical protein
MNAPVRIDTDAAALVEQVVIKGDLSRLSPEERAGYYAAVCRSVGLNPLTKPFEYITLNGKLVLYALKAATDQLRTIHKVSVVDLTESDWDGVYIVTAKVQNAEGRSDCAKGAVTINGLKGDALANAIMKAETKAKRRATLSICGLGLLDETEIETIPAEAKSGIARRAEVLRNTAQMPKRDAKPIYSKLQAEIDDAESREWLREWGKGNAERVAMLPEDWQEILRLRYQERMLDLQHREQKHDVDGVVWEDDGERPATAADKEDGLDIPPMLDRRPKLVQSLKQKLLADIPALGTVRDCLHYSLEMSKFDGDLSPADRDEIAGALRARQKVLMLNGGGAHGHH